MRVLAALLKDAGRQPMLGQEWVGSAPHVFYMANDVQDTKVHLPYYVQIVIHIYQFTY